METLSASLVICEENPPVTHWITLTEVDSSDMEP